MVAIAEKTILRRIALPPNTSLLHLLLAKFLLHFALKLEVLFLKSTFSSLVNTAQQFMGINYLK